MKKRQKRLKRFLRIAASILSVLIFVSCFGDGQAEFEKGKEIAGTEPGFDPYLLRFSGKRTDYKTAEKYFLSAAEKGHAEAQFTLGKYYSHGCGFDVEDVMHARIVSVEVVAKDKAKAVKWWRKAAEQGHVGAMVRLGDCCRNGDGMDPDPAEAVKWWQTASEQGDAEAQYKLGMCYEEGTGVEPDKAEAFKWYRTAAEQDNGYAMYALGKCYRDGIGVEQDLNEAMSWFKKAVEQGVSEVPEAQREIGALNDRIEAQDLLKKAENGDVYAMVEIGNHYSRGEGESGKMDPTEAARWYLKAAELGYPNAMVKIAECYRDGNGVKQDTDEAIKWYRKCRDTVDGYDYLPAYERLRDLNRRAAWHYVDSLEKQKKDLASAEDGDAESMYALGNTLFGQNDPEAVKWYRQAAEKGHMEAQYKLAEIYRMGKAVEQDMSEALKWYLKAAEQGQPEAMNEVCKCYLDGNGTERDVDKAVEWYFRFAETGRGTLHLVRRAWDDYEWIDRLAERGDAEAMYQLGRVYSRMPVDEEGTIDKAEALEWFRKAAEKDHEVARFEIANCYREGDGVEQNPAEAFKWYRKAADQSLVYAEKNGYVRDFKSVDGMYRLAECYRIGDGVEPDSAEAFKWYRKAAEIGKNRPEGSGFESSFDAVNAMYRLGDCYWAGEGVEGDATEAIKWYRNAFENGRELDRMMGGGSDRERVPVSTDALIRLGDCYRTGIGVEKNASEAVEWFGRALENGAVNAREYLRNIAAGSDEKAAGKAKALLEKAGKK